MGLHGLLQRYRYLLTFYVSTIDHCRSRCKGREGLPLIHSHILFTLSLDCSTVQLHCSLGRRRACPCSEAGFSSQNGDRAWGVYYVRTAFSCRLLRAQGLNTKDIQKEVFPVYGGKCLSRKAVHNWVEKFSQWPSKVSDDETDVRKWLRQESKDVYAAGFGTLVKRWDKCSNVCGGYVEKWMFLSGPNILYLTSYIHLWSVYWLFLEKWDHIPFESDSPVLRLFSYSFDLNIFVSLSSYICPKV
jgi:hypothetical protein